MHMYRHFSNPVYLEKNIQICQSLLWRRRSQFPVLLYATINKKYLASIYFGFTPSLPTRIELGCMYKSSWHFKKKYRLPRKDMTRPMMAFCFLIGRLFLFLKFHLFLRTKRLRRRSHKLTGRPVRNYCACLMREKEREEKNLFHFSSLSFGGRRRSLPPAFREKGRKKKDTAFNFSDMQETYSSKTV